MLVERDHGRLSGLLALALQIAVMECVTRLATAEPASPAPDASGRPARGARDPSDVADEANNPLSKNTQLQFKPSYTFPNGDTRYKAETLFEPILPYPGFLIPDLEVADFWSIARLQVTAESLQDNKGQASGLTDLTLTDLVAHQLGPLNGALGFATVFPMATTAALGQGKWQLGPAAALRLESFPTLKIAVLVQNFYSVAGNSQSPDLAYVTVQPFITLHLPAALFFSSDAPMSFYWLGGQSTVPVNLGFGHAFGDHFASSVRGWYTVADADRGTVKGEIMLNFQP
jgi:hypothetical protein